MGCGALGTHLADTLTRAGIGRLDLVDRDVIEWTNLQRQVLFDEADAKKGLPKAVAAAKRLREINRDVAVHGHVEDCSKAFLDGLARKPDLILDGTDNFPTRYLINDWCRQRETPWIYGGAVGAEGASMVIETAGACLRCIWPEAPSQADTGTCETKGILAPTIAAVTAFQAAEALKLIVGAPTTRGVFTCDVWRGAYQLIPVGDEPASDCVCCGLGQHPALDQSQPAAVSMCGRDAVQVLPEGGEPIDLKALALSIADAVDDLEQTPYLTRFRVDETRITVFPGGRALIFGCSDPLRARALYDRWLR